MNKNKLSTTTFGKLIAQITSREKEQFAAYAHFEITNTAKQNLFDHIIDCQLKRQDPLKEQLETMIDLPLRSVLSEFTTILEGFIAGKQIAKAKSGPFKVMKYMVLISFLQKCSEIQLVKSIYRKAANSLTNAKKKGFNEQLFTWVFADQIYFHPDVKELVKGVSFLESIQDVKAFGDRVYTLSQLQYIAAQYSEKLNGNSSLSIDWEEEVSKLKIDKQDDLQAHYLKIIQLYAEFKLEMFLQLHTEIAVLINRYSNLEQDLLLRHWITLCSKGINEGHQLIESATAVYELLFNNKILLNSPSLLKAHLINYIGLACNPKIEQRHAARLFLDKHKVKLKKLLRIQVVNLCEAKLLIAEEKYEEAFEILSENNFADTQVKIIARTTRLMACFDADHDKLDFELKAFQSYLKNTLKINQEVAKELFEANHNFHKMLNRLVNPKKIGKDQLRSMLTNMKNLAHRSWLQQKIDE